MNIINYFISNYQVPPAFLAKKIQETPKESSFLRDLSSQMGSIVPQVVGGLAAWILVGKLIENEPRNNTDVIVSNLFYALIFKMGLLYNDERKKDFRKKAAIQITHPNEIESNVQQKSQAIVIFESIQTPKDMFYVTHEVLTSMEGLREKGVFPIIIQTGSSDAMCSSLEKLRAQGVRIHGIVINGHGEEGRIWLSGHEQLKASDTSDLVKLNKSIDSVTTNCPPWILLLSCFGAAESNANASVARAFSQAIPKSTVIASSEVITVDIFPFLSDMSCYIRFVEETYPNTGQNLIFPSVEFRNWWGRDTTRIFLEGRDITQSSG